MRVEIVHLFASPGHNFVGHYGQKPGTHPMDDRDAVECVAGRGIRGDRYFEKQPGGEGQVTFFAFEVHEDLSIRLAMEPVAPSVYRRNIVVRGVDLNALIGRRFEMQGVEFEGTEESKPCLWMDQAFGPGAKEALRGRGGLRARVLRGGTLKKGWSDLRLLGEQPMERAAS
ncbi:MAG: molybdenum cofactor biosysynthesis protein [Verrucomicrobia bacterium]|nr:molybdenum cofactor biosysynthesis protein [Verrucomicrobiota bacterium]